MNCLPTNYQNLSMIANPDLIATNFLAMRWPRTFVLRHLHFFASVVVLEKALALPLR